MLKSLRAKLSREARIASGYCTIRVSVNTRHALHLVKVAPVPRERSAGASMDDKVAELLLSPRLSEDTVELFDPSMMMIGAMTSTIEKALRKKKRKP